MVSPKYYVVSIKSPFKKHPTPTLVLTLKIRTNKREK